MGKVADRIYGCHPWKIIEESWSPEKNLVGESIFSLANEYMGIRDYAEEGADAPELKGIYFGGVYEWGNVTPQHYKGIIERPHYMVCAADFLHVHISQKDQAIRLSKSIWDYRRELDLKNGLVMRSYITTLPQGGQVKLTFERLLGMDAYHYAAQRITLEADRDAQLTLRMGVDGNIHHQMAGKCQWQQLSTLHNEACAAIRMKTATTDKTVDYLFAIEADAALVPYQAEREIGFDMTLDLKADIPCTVTRRICNVVDAQGELSLASLVKAPSFDALLEQNTAHWDAFWQVSDVTIEGDLLNQQGIRYCLFQLHQTYRGLDGRHNIGAKGLTGEAYNGNAFWDSETYCLPYYLFNDWQAARSLLMFRYYTLEPARARAKELDCKGACYPISSMNGHESCSLWQHASLQMQPSTAVAYAIMYYAQTTGDEEFLYHEGIEMLTEISRYVVSRGAWNADHTGFGFWGVMGPDEFHLMVNNNFYTNYMGRRTLLDTLAVLSQMDNADDYAVPEERAEWQLIADHMLLCRRRDGVIEQHDGYFDLPQLDIHSIPVEEFPLYSHWSYDRLYRTDMIKQPDVLMAMFLHPEDFTMQEIEANYDYYEPRCIHESSLSPSIHSIIAQSLGRDDVAADFFRFATRMDLDNYNRNTTEGLHTTSIAAAWVTIVTGFGGLRTEGSTISLTPHLPKGWQSYSFRLRVGDSVICATVDKVGCHLSLVEGDYARIKLNGEWVEVRA